MNRVMLAALAAALVIPAAASADEMAGHAMNADHMAPATMMCRAPMTGEKPNAMMAMHDAPLVCKALPKMVHGAVMGPQTTAEMTAKQIDDTWRAYLQNVLLIPQEG